MIRYQHLGLIFAAVLTVLVVREASAGPPTDQLKASIDKVIQTLEDPALKADGTPRERRMAVRKMASKIFDFRETAKRSLARHWHRRTDEEREEFVQLFEDLLERSYISKIELYGGEKIQYIREHLDDNVATVSTIIVTDNGQEVPVDYRMLRRGDRWLVYDVSVEGVSLISNYRTQFNKIIRTSSYKKLVDKMKTKHEEFLKKERKKAKGK